MQVTDNSATVLVLNSSTDMVNASAYSLLTRIPVHDGPGWQ